MASVLHPDPFAATLLSSESLTLSLEQQNLIREVLDIACSDSQFADKAYRAIQRILTQGSAVVPIITSLSPGSATIGDPSFVLRVLGTGFKSGSIIHFAGQIEPTTHVSDTELTTGVDMSVWHGADILPVLVESPDGVISDPMNFVFEAGPITLSSSVPSASLGSKSFTPVPVNKEVKKEEKK